MAYNKRGYFLRARIIQGITAQYYEPENHAKCYKMVWRTQIYPRFGIGYRAYLKYCKAKEAETVSDPRQLKLIFD